uniref:hypothetical protein n=1 Tax=Klebsiella quasipneumoniae TaxID=1463165 RepID=UPI00352BB9DA
MTDIIFKSTIVFTIILGVGFIYFLRKSSPSISRYFEFTDESLSKQHLFKFSIGVPFIIAALLCVPIWLDKNITFNFTSQGYGNFLDIFKLPIGVWSLSIPLVAIVAHIHRTIQTASQIETTKAKNLADSFFSHHKFITEALIKLPEQVITINNQPFTKKLDAPYSLYTACFPCSSYNNGFSQNGFYDKLTEVKEIIDKVSNAIGETKKKGVSERDLFFLLHEVISGIVNLSNLMHISLYRSETNHLYMFKGEKRTFKLSFSYGNEKELKEDLKITLDFIIRIFELSNITIDLPTNIYFYAHSYSEKNYKFTTIFQKTIKYDCPVGFSISLNESKDTKISVLYLTYLAKLEKM